MSSRLAGEWAELALDAAELATKKAIAAKDAVDPAKQAERQQADRDRRTQIELLSHEQSALARFNPRRNRWPDLLKIDARINELELRRNRTAAEIQGLRDRLTDAANADRAALADWTLNDGSERAKPDPTVPALEQRITDLEAEHDASALALDRLLAERVAFVEKHRRRLVKDAEKATDDARARYETLVDQLAAAREELVDAAATTAWARLYPDQSLASPLPTVLIAVGRRQPVEQHIPGYGGQVAADNLWRLLRDDARLLVESAPADQVAALRGQSERAVMGREATWAGDRAAEFEREKAEKKKAREAFRREWGIEPNEWA